MSELYGIEFERQSQRQRQRQRQGSHRSRLVFPSTPFTKTPSGSSGSPSSRWCPQEVQRQLGGVTYGHKKLLRSVSASPSARSSSWDGTGAKGALGRRDRRGVLTLATAIRDPCHGCLIPPRCIGRTLRGTFCLRWDYWWVVLVSLL